MHRSLSALVPAVALTCALAAFAALVPSEGVVLVDNPSASSVVLARGVPRTIGRNSAVWKFT
jgi:hypothetical protein